MTKKTILINSVSEIKRGKATKNGKTWTWILSRVEGLVLDSQKIQSFSTFDDFNAYINQEIEVVIDVKENVKDGKTYTNYVISLPKFNVEEEIKLIKERLDKLEKDNDDIGLVPPEEVALVEEIQVGDLPF